MDMNLFLILTHVQGVCGEGAVRESYREGKAKARLRVEPAVAKGWL